jgi:polysaccharide biosynthesis/export protein
MIFERRQSMKRNTIVIFFSLLFWGLIINAVANQENVAFINEYRIGARDLLEISVFELPELSQMVRVSEDGSITLPLLGKVTVAGLTKEELEKRLASLLFEKNYLRNARVTVFIKEYQSSQVAVIGAVAKSGIYNLISHTTLLQIISQAGGLTDRASSELFILREDKKTGIQSRIVIDLDDLVNNGNQKLNVPLEAGDTINIPMDQIVNVFVFGEVRNPGALQVKMSKKITILQAIAQAGGLTEGASKRSVTITRKDRKSGKETKILINLNDVIKGKKPAIELQEGDVVYVPDSIF